MIVSPTDPVTVVVRETTAELEDLRRKSHKFIERISEAMKEIEAEAD